jgi:hypothetical protein
LPSHEALQYLPSGCAGQLQTAFLHLLSFSSAIVPPELSAWADRVSQLSREARVFPGGGHWFSLKVKLPRSLRNFASYFANFAVRICFNRKGRKELAKDRKAN